MTVTYGERSAKIALNEGWITGDRIARALKMPFGFSGEFILKALKSKSGKQSVPFEIESGTRTSYLLDISKIRNGEEYEPIFQDLRGDNVSQLTPEEKAAIQKQFKEIDADGSGYITKEEAIRYVTKKLNKMLQSREESISKLMAANPEKKSELEAQLESTRHIAREGMKIELQYLFEKDTNADGKISYDEFLKAEAYYSALKRKHITTTNDQS